MKHEDMVEYLEEDDFQCIMHESGGAEMLRNILFYGFTGYSDHTPAEIRAEYKERKALRGEPVDDLVEFLYSKEEV